MQVLITQGSEDQFFTTEEDFHQEEYKKDFQRSNLIRSDQKKKFFNDPHTYIGVRTNILTSEFVKIEDDIQITEKDQSILQLEKLQKKINFPEDKNFEEQASNDSLFKANLQRQKTLQEYENLINDEDQQHQQKIRQVSFIVNGKCCYYGLDSLFYFDNHSKFRIKLAEIHESDKFIWIVRIMIVVNILVYALHDYQGRIYPEKEKKDLNMALSVIQKLCDIFFLLEMISSIIVCGAIFEQGTYFRNWYSWLNFFSIMAGIVLFSENLSDTEYLVLAIIEKLRTIRLCQTFIDLKMISDGLVLTLPGLKNNILSLIGVMIFYAILGLHMFMGALSSRCRVVSEPLENGEFPVDESITNLCGNWMCPEGTYCRMPSDYNLQQDPTENDLVQLNYGFTKYDNIFWAFFSVFLYITTTGWSSVVFIYQRYLDATFVSLFFVSMMLLTAFILVNMLMGALQDGFNQISLRMKNGIIEEKQDEYNENAIKINQLQQKYLEDLQKLSNPIKLCVKKYSRNDRILTSFVKSYLQKPAQKFILKVFISIVFDWIVKVSIILMLLILCLDNHNNSISTQKQINLADFILFFIFALELLIKFISDGVCYFNPFYKRTINIDDESQQSQKASELNLIKIEQQNNNEDSDSSIIKESAHDPVLKYFNFLDLILLIINMLEIIIKGTLGMNIIHDETAVGGFFKICKSLRFFRFLYTTKQLQPLDGLIYAFFTTIREVSHYIVLIIVFSLTFTFIGAEMFSNRVRFNEETMKPEFNLKEGIPPRVNYDNFINSLFATFQFVLNDEWHMSMFDYMRAQNYTSSFFYIAQNVLGVILLMKFFLAIFIGKYIQIVKEKKCLHSNDIEDPISQDQNVQHNNSTNSEGCYQDQQEIQSDNLRMEKLQQNLGNEGTTPPPQSPSKKSPRNDGEKPTSILFSIENDRAPRNDIIRITPIDNNTPQQSIQYKKKKTKEISKQSKEIKSYGNYNYIKYKLRKLAQNQYFDNVILVVIFISCIIMALDEPAMDPKSDYKIFLFYLDLIITVIYVRLRDDYSEEGYFKKYILQIQ